MKLTKSTKGFDAEIQVGGSTFSLQNVNEESGQAVHIDIYDESGKFLDEFCSGCSIDFNDDPEELEKMEKLIHDYILENLIF